MNRLFLLPFLAFCLHAVTAHAATTELKGPLWQLTIQYDHQSLQVTSTKRILRDSSAKKISSPGLAGALMTIPATVEWLDSKGQILKQSKTTIPLGQRAIQTAGEPCIETVPENGAFVVRLRGPRSYRGANRPRKVRISPLLNSAKAVVVHNTPLFQWTTTEVRLPTSGFTPALRLAPPPLSATKIRDTGADSNRHVLVMLSEGYTAAQINAGDFTEDALTMLSEFPGKAPWDSLLNLTNIYRVDVTSAQSGADIPPEGVNRDTYFNATYWYGGIERLLSLDATGLQRAFDTADALVGAGVWDTIAVVVNSTKYGGAGGSVAVSALNFGSLVLAHELGHTIFSLADEYGGTNSTAPEVAPEPNVDYNLPPKWDEWIEAGTSIPTPNTSQNASVVGAFEGARYYDLGMYRPQSNCAMREIDEPFCAVCKDTLLAKYFSTLTLADSVTPTAGTSATLDGSDRSFTVTTAPFPDLSYRWTYCGNLIERRITGEITLSGTDNNPGTCELKLTVAYNGTHIRSQSFSTDYTWNVTGCAAVDECGVCNGDSSSCPIPSETITDPSVTLTKTGTSGGKCSFTATVLGDTSEPASGVSLQLQRKKAGATRFRNKTTATSSSAGTAFFTNQPRGLYRINLPDYSKRSRRVRCGRP